MNKIAILPLKEMPSSCMECKLCGFYKFNHIHNVLVEIDCKILDKFDVKGLPLDYINPNCPLISIDLDELESAIDTLCLDIDFSLLIGNCSHDENIVTETLKLKKEQNKDKAIRTIKSTIDKLKGVK